MNETNVDLLSATRRRKVFARKEKGELLLASKKKHGPIQKFFGLLAHKSAPRRLAPAAVASHIRSTCSLTQRSRPSYTLL